MINGLNDSKKHFFVWAIVTIVLFIGFSIGIQCLFSYLVKSGELDAATETVEIMGKQFSSNLLIGAFLYVIACLPMGWFVRSKFMCWFVHIPTEKIRYRYNDVANNPIVSFFILMWCWILLFFNAALLLFYICFSIITGIVIFPYHIISGIILMCKKKI